MKRRKDHNNTRTIVSSKDGRKEGKKSDKNYLRFLWFCFSLLCFSSSCLATSQRVSVLLIQRLTLSNRAIRAEIPGNFTRAHWTSKMLCIVSKSNSSLKGENQTKKRARSTIKMLKRKRKKKLTVKECNWWFKIIIRYTHRSRIAWNTKTQTFTQKTAHLIWCQTICVNLYFVCFLFSAFNCLF